MNLSTIAVAASVLLCTLPASAADAGNDPSSAASMLVGHFMQAWRASDAKGLAGLFASDADFVNPWGASAHGRDQIEAFYAAAFAHGFAGSNGVGDVIAVRTIAPDLAVLDGRWRIDGAKNADGSARPGEKGILFAVIGKRGQGWQILALRENAGASDLVPIAAGSR